MSDVSVLDHKEKAKFLDQTDTGFRAGEDDYVFVAKKQIEADPFGSFGGRH